MTNASPHTDRPVPTPLPLKVNVIWSSAGSLTKTACTWLMTIAVVRLSSGFNDAGVLALAMSISNLVFPIAEYRLRTVQVTDVRHEHSTAQYLGLRSISSVAALAIGIVYTLATTDRSALGVITVYVASQVIATYLEGYHAIEQRHMRMDYIGISYLLQGVGGLVAFVVGILAFQSLLAAVSLLALVTLAVGLFYDVPRARRFERIVPAIQWRHAVRTFTRLFPLAMVNTALSVVTLVPRQHLASTLGTEALGIYASIAAPTVIIQASATYIYTPVLGRLIELLTSQKQRGMKMLVRVCLLFVMLGAVSCLAFWIAGRWLMVTLFGPEIETHVYLVQPALVMSLVTAFVWFTNDLLLGLRDFKGCFLGGIVAAVVTVIVTPSLTSLFGLNGPSAVGIVASLAALAVMGWFFGRAYRRIEDRTGAPSRADGR